LLKGNGLGTSYITVYMNHTHDRKHFRIIEVSADYLAWIQDSIRYLFIYLIHSLSPLSS